MRALYFLFLFLPFITPVIKTQLSNTTSDSNMDFPTMAPTCSCPHTCNNIWRGNSVCDMDCNIPECDWDNGDCNGHIIGTCLGNVTIENIETHSEIIGYCDERANTERICENSHHLPMTLPWRVKTYSCKWVVEPYHRKLQLPSCHSIISCASDKWCKQNCWQRIKDYPNKCAWDHIQTEAPTKYPSKFPTKFPSKYPTKFPTKFPSKYPSKFPSEHPTIHPTTNTPTISPSLSPSTLSPTPTPTNFPSQYPSRHPSSFPTKSPTNLPVIPSPPEIHHHHYNGDSDDDTNKFDMAIVGIIAAALVVVIGIIIFYRRQIHKDRSRENIETRRQRNLNYGQSNHNIPQVDGTRLPVGQVLELKTVASSNE